MLDSKEKIVLFPVILSLFDQSGVWSKPYKEAGYNVIRVDLSEGDDVRLFKIVPDVRGILAAPPCTAFALSGAQYLGEKDKNGKTLDALSMVDSVMRIIMVHEPVWWVLENPVGRLNKWLGEPTMRFHPYEYGDPYKKKTCLWGNFNIPEKNVVDPIRGTKQGSWIQSVGGSTKDREKIRSITPEGFSRAFFNANP